MRSMITNGGKFGIERKETTLSDIMQEPEQVQTDTKWGQPLKESLLLQKQQEEEALLNQRIASNSSRGSRRSAQRAHHAKEQASFVSDEEEEASKKKKKKWSRYKHYGFKVQAHLLELLVCRTYTRGTSVGDSTSRLCTCRGTGGSKEAASLASRLLSLRGR